MELVLYSHWRATAPYRVRIGLHLKGLTYRYEPVDLAAGRQREETYRAINSQHLVPALVAGERVVTQSLAILEWLEEIRPEPALLPRNPADRAMVRSMANIVACDIHPLNNLRVLRTLETLQISEADRKVWIERWIIDGFTTLESLVVRYGAGFCFGDSPTLADCCLIPQVYGAQRYEIDLTPFPAICAIAARTAAHSAFAAAHPARQPGATAI